MDLIVHEDLFSVHTKRITNNEHFPTYYISVKLTIEPDLKTHLDNKPYYELANVALELQRNRPLYHGSLANMVLLHPPFESDLLNYTMEKAVYQELIYQVDSKEQQVSVEEEIIASIYSYYKRAIRLYIENLNQIQDKSIYGKK